MGYESAPVVTQDGSLSTSIYIFFSDNQVNSSQIIVTSIACLMKRVFLNSLSCNYNGIAHCENFIIQFICSKHNNCYHLFILQAYIRRQRYQVLEARRKMMILPPSTHYHTERYGDETHSSFYDSSGYASTFTSSQSDSGYFRESEFNFKLGYDASNLSYKSQEHYAKISAKAAANFGALSLSERHEFYYMFTKNGFMEAMHTGKLPDGTELKSIGRGRYVDPYGIIRDQHGPFWPSDYGPLFPAPSHKRLIDAPQELLTYSTRGEFNLSRRS